MQFSVAAVAAAIAASSLLTGVNAFVAPSLSKNGLVVVPNNAQKSRVAASRALYSPNRKWQLLSTLNEEVDAIAAALADDDDHAVTSTSAADEPNNGEDESTKASLEDAVEEAKEAEAEVEAKEPEPYKLVLEEVLPASYKVESGP